jgi:SAM-dependent methyltransferase
MPDQPHEISPAPPADEGANQRLSATRFDHYYYAHDCGIPYERNDHWLSFFGQVADGIVGQIAPTSVLDVGCAMGFLVEALRQRGVAAWGIDLSDYAIAKVDPSVTDFCSTGSAAEPLPDGFPESFDLVTCIEVVEHIDAALADEVVTNLCRWGRRVLISSSSTDYGEPTHVNVHPPAHWAARFASNRMLRTFDVDVSFLTAWATLFEHTIVAIPAVVARYEREYAETRLENVHLRSRLLDSERSLAAAEARIRELDAAAVRPEQAKGAIDRIVAAELRAMQLRERLASLQAQLDAHERDAWEMLGERGGWEADPLAGGSSKPAA